MTTRPSAWRRIKNLPLDWRGWIALTWILFWGTAYIRMALVPRLAPVLDQVFASISR